MPTPYRVRFGDNPYLFGRTTMPKGALLSRGPLDVPPGGPGTAAAGALGTGYGLAPAAPLNPPAPSTFQTAVNAIPEFPTATFDRVFQQIVAAMSRSYQGAAAVTGQVTGANARYNQRNITDLGGRMEMPSNVVPNTSPPPTTLRYAKETAGARVFGSNYVGGENVTHAFSRGFSNTQLIQGGQFPIMSVAEAQRAGLLEKMIGVGYRMDNGTLYPSDALLAQGAQNAAANTNGGGSGGGGGGGQNNTIGLLGRYGPGGGYGYRGDKWVTSEKAAASFWRRKMRGGNDGEQAANNRNMRRDFQAIGLVNLNVSAG